MRVVEVDLSGGGGHAVAAGTEEWTFCNAWMTNRVGVTLSGSCTRQSAGSPRSGERSYPSVSDGTGTLESCPTGRTVPK